MEQQSFAAIEHVSKDIVFKYDFGSELITLAGALLFKLTGVSEVECKVEDLVSGESVLLFDTAQIKQTIRAIKAGKHKEFILNVQNRQKDSVCLSLDYYFVYKRDDDTEVSAVGVISDITEQMEAKAFYDKAITLWASKQDECVAAVSINISNGTIISGRSKLLGKQRLDGQDGNVYFQTFFKNIVDQARRKQIKTDFLPRNLMKAYREGQTHLSYEIEMNLNGALGWYQMTGSLHKNPKTGDLIALLEWRDINNIKLQQKINQLLFYKEYDCISCIFAKTNSYIMMSQAENSTMIPSSASHGYEAMMKRVIDQCNNSLDKEYLQFSFSIKNLLTQLSISPTYSFVGHGKYPDGSPAVKFNSFTYLDKNRKIILYTCKDITSKAEVLSFRDDNAVCSVPFRDILYVESFGKRSVIVTQRKKYDVNEMLSGIQERLPGREFMRCHRCYIVRYDAMQKIDKYSITMRNGDEISVSRSSVDVIRNKLKET